MLRQAVILVGGLGARLGERTKTLPKPMLHVGGRPFLPGTATSGYERRKRDVLNIITCTSLNSVCGGTAATGSFGGGWPPELDLSRGTLGRS